MKVLRLKENHDFALRVRSVFEFMEENGVMIEYHNGEFLVTDLSSTDSKFKRMKLFDIDLTHRVDSLPEVPFKLIVNEDGKNV